MSDLPLVSCVLLTHQFEAYVQRSIDSCLAQDWPADRLEIIVVDDGSTDSTPEIVAAYGDRITSIRKPNEGLMPSVTRGLAAARGDFITLVSGDDEVCRDRIRRQLAVLAGRPEVGLIYGDMEVIDADSNVLHPSFAVATGIRTQSGSVLGPLLKQNFVSGGAAMVRGALKDRFWPAPPEVPWEDWWMALKVAEVAEIAYLDVPIYRYRLHGRNMNFGAEGERFLNLVRTELPFRRWLMREGVDHSGVDREFLAAAVLRLDRDAAKVADATGAWLEELLPVTDEDRRAAARVLAAGDAFAAIGHDPGHAAARAALGIAPMPDEPLAARRDVTLALLDEVAERPDLLDRYLARVGAGDDATLVLYAPSRDQHEAVAELGPLVERLADPSAPDVLLHPAKRTWWGERALRARARTVLTAEPRPALGLATF